MAFTPFALNLTADQQEVLTDLDIAPNSLYIVNNDDVPSTGRVNGYTNGYYIVFFDSEGHTETDQQKFVEDLFGAKYTKIIAKNRGVYVYGGPCHKFRILSNKVTVNTIST